MQPSKNTRNRKNKIQQGQRIYMQKIIQIRIIHKYNIYILQGHNNIAHRIGNFKPDFGTCVYITISHCTHIFNSHFRVCYKGLNQILPIKIETEKISSNKKIYMHLQLYQFVQKIAMLPYFSIY